MSTTSPLQINLGEKYEILEKLGSGSFGDIFKVLEVHSHQIFAAKLERKEKKHSGNLLIRESQILKELMNFSHNFPQIHETATTDQFTFITMTCLGANLESVRQQVGGSISIQSVTYIALQMINAIQALHDNQYIHRDIKPENFVIGNTENHSTVYLIDFGLTKSFVDDTGKHIPFIENQGLVGTARYTSINSHQGYEQSRRDDLESIGYVLLYIANGNLPWQNIVCDNRKEKFQKIFDIKKTISVEEMCQKMPLEYHEYFQYIKSLKFDETPDYSQIKDLFYNCLVNLNFKSHLTLDWCNEGCLHQLSDVCEFSIIQQDEENDQQYENIEIDHSLTNADISDLCQDIDEIAILEPGIQCVPEFNSVYLQSIQTHEFQNNQIQFLPAQSTQLITRNSSKILSPRKEQQEQIPFFQSKNSPCIDSNSQRSSNSYFDEKIIINKNLIDKYSFQPSLQKL